MKTLYEIIEQINKLEKEKEIYLEKVNEKINVSWQKYTNLDWKQKNESQPARNRKKIK